LSPGKPHPTWDPMYSWESSVPIPCSRTWATW
jgi:hypothetical protein